MKKNGPTERISAEDREILALKAHFIPTQQSFIMMEIVMLLTHIGFAYWFWRDRAPILFYYNIISVLVFLLGTIFAIRNITRFLWAMAHGA